MSKSNRLLHRLFQEVPPAHIPISSTTCALADNAIIHTLSPELASYISQTLMFHRHASPASPCIGDMPTYISLTKSGRRAIQIIIRSEHSWHTSKTFIETFILLCVDYNVPSPFMSVVAEVLIHILRPFYSRYR